MSRVARRYAKALFGLARERAQDERVEGELEALARAFQDRDVARLVSSPLVSPEARSEVVAVLRERAKLSELVSRFLAVLAEAGRLAELPSVAEHYRALQDEALGRLRLRVSTAMPLEGDELERLVEVFSRLSQRQQVLPEVRIDPSLLGGIVVEARGTVYDGSVRARLRRLVEQVTRPD
ncbi:MAG: ATP synthase subunit delta [Candidatus Binatia bacterium]|nr:MAG: ATP synthase subunit delta [Candidatus Binatia bacterium]